MNRKIVTLIISVLMLAAFLPASVFAADEEPAVPESAVWDAFTLRGVLSTDRISNIATPDESAFTVKYSDGSTKRFVYREIVYDEGKDSEFTDSGFFAEGEDPANAASCLYTTGECENPGYGPVNFKDGYNEVKLPLTVPYVTSGKGTDEEEVEYKDLLVDVRVLCAPDHLKSVKFVPADGFNPTLYIGLNYITPEQFFGKGNAFKVTKECWDEDAEDYNIIVTQTYR